jgi:hypothetical protein
MLTVMRKLVSIIVVTGALALASACANKNADSTGPHATVYLRDGTSYAGTVKSTTPTQITVAGDDNTTRTYNMKDIRSVEYGDAQVAQTPNDSVMPANPAPPNDPAARNNPAPTRSAPAPVPVVRYHPQESHINTRTYELPVGTEVAVRTGETIDSGKAVEGQTFAADVSRDVLDSAGDVVIPRGSNAQIVIRSASKGGRFRGTSDLVLDLQSVSVDGRLYQIDTTSVSERGKAGLGKNKRTAEYVGGGALVGTIIGAIAGHGKGAAIGAGSGAAAGVAADLLTRGGAVRVPAETQLTFKLDKPLRVYPAQ